MDGVPLELRLSLSSSKSCSDQDLPPRKATSAPSEMSLGQVAPKNSHSSKDSRHDSDDEVLPEVQEMQKQPLSNVSFEQLARLAQQEEYERRHTTSLEADIRRLVSSNSLDRRLRESLSIAYGNMIDQYKGGDQAGFTGLYEACERLTTRTYTKDQTMIVRDYSHIPEEAQESNDMEVPSVIHMLQPSDQDSVIAFLNKIRMDLDYLAHLVSRLPSEELTALTSSYHPAGVDLSVLPNHSHGRTSAYSRDSQMMKLSRRMDSLDRFHTQDPFFVLLYGIFDSSAPSGSEEYRRKTEVWSRTCAKVMTERKPGSEEFVVATIDAFCESSDWRSRPEMESFLMQILAEGSFLLDPPTEPCLEKPGSMEPDSASHAIAVAEFFDRQTRRLFDLLAARDTAHVVPHGVLEFIHAILRHIRDARIRELAKKFVVSRWFFASFLSSVLIYPEVGLRL